MNILIAGDCNGKLSALFKRVASVNKSNGPFAALLCVGGFFSESDAAGDAAEESCELADWIAEGKKAPVPTYFIGAYGKGSAKAIKALQDADTNIHYLGRSGLTQVAGLSVAFLDGLFDEAAFSADVVDGEASCRNFRELDVAKLKLSLDGSGDVDVLMTCQWPASILSGVAGNSQPKCGSPKNAVAALDELADLTRPRYHICSGEGVFYARAPYQNPDRGVGSHVTRFISLAPVGNAAKEKSLHALKLVPMALMELDVLMAKPADTTPFPYGKKAQAPQKRKPEEDLSGQAWRWQESGKRKRPVANPIPGRPGVVKDAAATIYAKNLPFSATEEDIEGFFSRAGPIVDIRRPPDDQGRPVGHCFIQFASAQDAENSVQMNEEELMGRRITIEMSTSGSSARQMQPATGKPLENCWFCLSNPSASVWLVVSVAQEIYLTLDKAPMHPQHCLLIPVEHYPSTLSLSPNARSEVMSYIGAVRKFYQSQGLEMVGFERFMRLRRMGGNHCHINLVPISKAAAESARGTFEEMAKQDGFTLDHLEKGTPESLSDALGDSEYFAAYLPDSSMLVTKIQREPRHPMDYGRRVLAQLLGCPDKANPKECQLSQDEEENLANEFKAGFKDFDVMA